MKTLKDLEAEYVDQLKFEHSIEYEVWELKQIGARLQKELKRHKEAVEYYRTWFKNVPLRMKERNEETAKRALKEGETILRGERSLMEVLEKGRKS